jgi:acetyltransferase-like isoleucine patch superfamily enzyme
MNNIHSTVVIHDDLKIGENVDISAFVFIGNKVTIGNNVIIKPFCEIRDGCVIGDNVNFGSRCTLAANTVIENDVIIKYGFVATDTPKVLNSERVPCIIKKKSRFGANVTVMPGITIGENSEIGACSQVRHDVPPNEIWYGNPAKFYKQV